jgi:choline dehydrogenase-like flavoprotein
VQWLKTKYIKGYHYFGATAMRPLSKGGVVDSDCKVYGVTGLRVVDVSIMPVKVRPTTLRPTCISAAGLEGDSYDISCIPAAP